MHDTTFLSIPKNAEKLFNILLYFYPEQYRKQFGREMRFLFEDIYQEELDKKGSVGVEFWLSQFVDITKSAIEQHSELLRKLGMRKYLKQTFNVNAYNIIGALLLTPFLTVFAIDIIARILQGDLVHYNRSVYNFLSHTPLYWTPVLFIWVILFPLFAVVINVFPLLLQKSKTKGNVFKSNFVKKNVLTLVIIMIGAGALAFLKLHDFVPCTVYGLIKVGFGQLPHIISVCRNA